MQNLAILTNTANTQPTDDLTLLSQNCNTENLISKGQDFLKVLNGTDKNCNGSVERNYRQYTDRRDLRETQTQRQNTADTNEVKDTAGKKSEETDKFAQSEQSRNDNKNAQSTNDNKNETNTSAQKDDKKTLDEVKAHGVKEYIEETAQGTNTKVLDSNEVIQEAVNKINNLIETSLDGQLNLEDVEALKSALEEIQTKINNNEIVVSEETKQMLSDTLNNLLSQNPADLAVAELQKDLKQLAKDIEASAFKAGSQIKLEEENANPSRGLELNVQDNLTQKESVKKETAYKNTTQNTSASQSAVNVSSQVRETQSVENGEKIDIEQEILDEMNVQVDEVSSSQTSTSSNNQSFTTAQDEVIKLQIENADSDSTTPVTFAFDKTIKPANNTNSQIRMEGLAKELNANDILNQIGSKFEQLKDGSSTKITMTLRPNDLGRVTIELLSNANGISTNIIAQNSQVKELLDKNLDILKQQLVSQGINVQNVQIKTVEQNSQANLNNGYQNSDAQNRGEEQSRNNNQNSNGQNKEQREQNFKFNQSNVIENVDFENSAQNATASINTLRGKISYNL